MSWVSHSEFHTKNVMAFPLMLVATGSATWLAIGAVMLPNALKHNSAYEEQIISPSLASCCECQEGVFNLGGWSAKDGWNVLLFKL